MFPLEDREESSAPDLHVSPETCFHPLLVGALWACTYVLYQEALILPPSSTTQHKDAAGRESSPETAASGRSRVGDTKPELSGKGNTPSQVWKQFL